MSKNFTRYHSIPLLLALVILVTAVPATAGPAAALGSLNNSRTDTSETSKVSGIDDGYGSRLLFSSTAVMYNPGEVEVSVVGLGLPQAAVGITRSFSLEAGLTVAPGWFGEMFFAIPKFQVWSKGPWNLAIDAQTVLAKREAGPIGSRNSVWEVGSVPRMIGTVNLSRASVTLGVGMPLNTMGFRLEDPGAAFGNEASVQMSAGADVEVNPWMTLLTENVLYLGVVSKEVANSDFLSSTEKGTVVESLNGVRLHHSGFALDLAAGFGMSKNLSKSDPSAFPYLRVSYRF